MQVNSNVSTRRYISYPKNANVSQEKGGDFTEFLEEKIPEKTTSCAYPAASPKEDDIRYITWYTEEGIFCQKEGQTAGYQWSIAFEDDTQYDKVIELIGKFPSDWNMRFAAHENFWTDFLNDEIDIEGFMEFMRGTNKGIPDYSITIGDSMYVDKGKAQWAKYTNPLGSKFYTAEEMHQMQMEIIMANEAKLTKLTDSYEKVYKKTPPEYHGEKIFCEYPGGPLYDANGIAQKMWENFLAQNHLSQADVDAQRAQWRKRMGYPE